MVRVQFYKDTPSEQCVSVKEHKITFTYAKSTRSTLEYSLRIMVDDNIENVKEVYKLPYIFNYDGTQIEVSVK